MIAAIGAAVNEVIKRQKKPATLQEKAADALKALSDDALTKAQTAQVISDAFNGLLDNLQRQPRLIEQPQMPVVLSLPLHGNNGHR